MHKKTLLTLGRWALISALSVSAFIPVTKRAQALTINLGSGTTEYAVMNVSNANATVVAQYYTPGGGTPAYSQSYSLAPNARLRISLGNPADFPLSGPWQGSVVLSSDQDIVAAAVTRYTGRSPFDNAGGPPRADGDSGTEWSAYGAFNAGSTTLYAPLVQRVPRPGNAANIASRVTVQNTTGNPIQVFVNLNIEGTTNTALGPFNVPAFGSLSFDTANDSDPLVTAGLSGAVGARRGALVITATAPIVGVVEQNWDNPNTFQNWSGDYEMLTPGDAATLLFSPQAQRECRAATPCLRPDAGGNVASRFNTYSAFTLLNVGNAVADVQAVFIPGLGLPPNYYTRPITLNFQIQPQAFYDINLINGGTITPGNPLFSVLFDPLTGLNFRGSLRVTSSQPLVGIGFFQQPQGDNQNYVSTYGLVSPAGASSRIVAPWYDRDCRPGATPCQPPGPGVTVADYDSFSNLVIVNVGNAPATINSVSFYTQTGGTPIMVLSSFSLPAGAQYSINARGGGNVPFSTMQGLGEDFFGSVIVEGASGSLLKAIVTTASSRGSDTYSAFNR